MNYMKSEYKTRQRSRMGRMARGLAIAGIGLTSILGVGGCEPKDKLIGYETFQGKQYEVYERKRKPNSLEGLPEWYARLALTAFNCPYVERTHGEDGKLEIRVYPNPNPNSSDANVYIKFKTPEEAQAYLGSL